MLSNSLIAAAGLVSMVSAHGLVVTPPIRAVGPAMNATCGTAVTQIVTEDPTSHVEGLPEAAATDPAFNATACNLFLCKGLQFADNIMNVQKFTPGEMVNIKANITIAHTGPANVSVVDTVTNKVLGTSMISFPVYADSSLATLPANNSNFNITMPSNLGNACSVAGKCVVQWFWLGTEAEQTYESCMDFTMAGTAAASTMSTGSSSDMPMSAGSSSTMPMSAGSSSDMPMSAGSSSDMPMSAGSSSTMPMSAGSSSDMPMSAGSSSSMPMSAGSSSDMPMSAGSSTSSSDMPMSNSASPMSSSDMPGMNMSDPSSMSSMSSSAGMLTGAAASKSNGTSTSAGMSLSMQGSSAPAILAFLMVAQFALW